MSYKPVTVERFGGLNLSVDAADFGFAAASDLLNVEFSSQGTVHTRVGWAKLNATTGSARYTSLGFNGSYILAGNSSALDVIDTSGTRQSTTALDASNAEFAQFGTTSNAYTYISVPNVGAMRRLSGTTVSAPAGMPSGYSICVQYPDNRLVYGASSTSVHRVGFSNAGAAETWGANDYVDITPGDGENIRHVVSWRNLVFAFKHSKFAVFYGNSTDSTGATQFNYRMVSGPCPSPASYGSGKNVVAADDGVYFTNSTGVYRTTGGVPELISGPVEPFFHGVGPTTVTSLLTSLPSISGASYGMTYARGRLYISIPLGSATTNSHILVYDTVNRWWSVYQAAAGPLATMNVPNSASEFLHQKAYSDEGLLFAYSSGNNDIGAFSQAYSTDNGSGISSYYVSGYSDLGAPQDKVVREGLFTLRGIRGVTGTVSPSLLADYGNMAGTATSVTTTSSPVTSANRNSVRGREVAFKVSASSSQWGLDRVTLNVREAKSSGTDS